MYYFYYLTRIVDFNLTLSVCEKLVEGFKGDKAEILVQTLRSGRSILELINEAEL